MNENEEKYCNMRTQEDEGPNLGHMKISTMSMTTRVHLNVHMLDDKVKVYMPKSRVDD